MGAIKNHYHEEITSGQVSANEKAAHDWGRKDYQAELLEKLARARKMGYEDWYDYIEGFIKSVQP